MTTATKEKVLTYKSAKATISADAGTMEGYASTYNDVDRVGDRIMPGAFGTQPFKLPLFAYHEYPIGGAVATPDAKGLHVAGTLANTQAAQDVRELMKVGGIPSMSFGFDITKSEPNDFGGLDIYAVDTMEVSAVPIPCNPAAEIMAVKKFGPAYEKVGRRNADSDQKAIQSAHDYLVAAGAECGSDGKAAPPGADKGPVGDAPEAMDPPAGVDEPTDNPAGLAQAIDQMVDSAIESLDAGSMDEVDAYLSGLAAVSDQLLSVLGVPDADEEAA